MTKAEMAVKLELAERELNYKRQEIEGLKRSCEATTAELRAVRRGEADLERRLAVSERRVAEVERGAGAAAIEAALVQQELREQLARLRASSGPVAPDQSGPKEPA